MMLDMKRTFDEIVEAHSDPDRAEQILANPFYQSLSSSFAGTQEYMAMEKLGQLRRTEQWDLIVVDTPPSRSALDFLDAPQRLSRFLDGRLIKLLTAPTRAGGRAYLKVVNVGFGVLTGIVTKILGAQVLRDVQTFVAAFDTMFGGFRERAEDTYRLLQTPGTAFLIVATPEPDALREASYFVERLSEDRMPLAGLILNRVHRSPAARLSAARSLAAAEALLPAGGPARQCALSGREWRRAAGRRDAVPARRGRAPAARRADAAHRGGAPAGAAVHRGTSGRAGGAGDRPDGRRARPGRAESDRRKPQRQLAPQACSGAPAEPPRRSLQLATSWVSSAVRS